MIVAWIKTITVYVIKMSWKQNLRKKLINKHAISHIYNLAHLVVLIRMIIEFVIMMSCQMLIKNLMSMKNPKIRV